MHTILHADNNPGKHKPDNVHHMAKHKQPKPGAKKQTAPTPAPEKKATPPAAAKKAATTAPAPAASGFFNNILLLFLACICVALVIRFNKNWFDRVVAYWDDYQEQKNEPDLEQRKMQRYGNSYIISKMITDNLVKLGAKDSAVVLIPPTSYFEASQISYRVPEPAVFYYYTSLKTVWPDTKDTTAINWVVDVVNRNLAFIKIENAHQRSEYLQKFKQYKISL